MFIDVRLDWQKLFLVLSVWTAYGLFFGTQEYVREAYFGHPGSLAGHLTAWFTCGYSWALLTVPVVGLARRFGLERLKWTRFLMVHIPAALFFAAIQLGIFLFIASLLFPRAGRGPWDYYKFLLANELQTSVLVYLGIIAAVTVYDRFFRKSLQNEPGKTTLLSQRLAEATPRVRTAGQPAS